ncbi:MAG: hypothetical protein KC561_10145, partial [Myxococcales bacterium]|nr:hypothetical protein [Myxococcales bacterium]
MNRVFVSAAQLSGKFTGKPRLNLREMMFGAANKALSAAGITADQVDALYVGAMGSFEPEGFIGPLPIRLANSLKLRNADVTPMLIGSSEAGAWV